MDILIFLKGNPRKVKFVFIIKTGSCYWNENFIEILDDAVCDNIYQAMNMTCNHEIECTKCELFYIKQRCW